MELRFRTATKEDIPAVAALIAASVRELQHEYSEAQREAAIATVFSVDSRLIADGTYFLAFTSDAQTTEQLAGCGGWSRRKTLYGGDHQLEAVQSEQLDPAEDAAKIRAIFVHPDFTRRGVGSALLAQSERVAVQEGFSWFDMASTLSGLALYRRKGYQEQETLQVPIGSGESITVIRMTKVAGTPPRAEDAQTANKRSNDL